jgi:hypothetical protein
MASRSTFLEPERNKIVRAFERVYTLTEMTFTGKKTLQMFCSVAGMGKTEAIRRVMKKLGIEPHYASPSTAIGLCMDLWQHRNGAYFTDDCDTLARSLACSNIAKMAFGAQRLVVCPTTKEIQRNEARRIDDDDDYDPTIPPPTFKLESLFGMVWNSNQNYTDPKIVSADMAPHFQALVSRGLDPLWIPNDPQSTFDYVLYMIVGKGMLRGHRIGETNGTNGGFNLDTQNAVIHFLCKNALRLKEITPRMAHKLAMSRRNDPDWEQAWKEQLLVKPAHKIELPERIPHVGPNRPSDWDDEDDKDDNEPGAEVAPTEVPVVHRQGSVPIRNREKLLQQLVTKLALGETK